MLDDLLSICFKYHKPEDVKQFCLSSEFYSETSVLGYYDIKSYCAAKKDMLEYIDIWTETERRMSDKSKLKFHWQKEPNKLTAICVINCMFGLVLVLKLVSTKTLV